MQYARKKKERNSDARCRPRLQPRAAVRESKKGELRHDENDDAARAGPSGRFER